MATDTKTPTLDNLNDYQKSLLTKLSYVDLNTDQFKELTERGETITISDLSYLLSNPDEPYLGGMHINDSIQFTNLTNLAIDVDTSNKEIIQELVDAGLGDLNIVSIVDDSKTGFQAICFSDSLDNKGFAYRGTDVKSLQGFLSDVHADLDSVLNNTSVQSLQANEFFEQFSNSNGKNYLYGHSLGGFLAEDVFANHYENIENTFVINPLDINQDKLDTKEKIDAFNDPEKLSYYAIGGDLANTINDSSLYENNIKYIKNSNTYNNELRNHSIESASFDKDNNFITTTREEAYKGYEISDLTKVFVGTATHDQIKPIIRKGFNIGSEFSNLTTSIVSTTNNRMKSSIRFAFNKIRNFVVNTFDKIKDILNKNDSKENDINNSNLNIHNNNLNVSSFRESLNPENYINDTSYTRTDYENSKAVLQNPMNYINLSPKNNESIER